MTPLSVLLAIRRSLRRFIVVRLITSIAVLFLLTVVSVWADGGTVLTHQTVNGLDITVFAAPVPLRAGPVDVSVLVQRSGQTRAMLDASVEVAWSSVGADSPDWLPPCCTMQGSARLQATQGHSQNKMLYSAIIAVRNAGPSELVVRVQQAGREALIACPITAGPPCPPWLAYWPFLAFPPVGIALFALRERLVRRGS